MPEVLHEGVSIADMVPRAIDKAISYFAKGRISGFVSAIGRQWAVKVDARGWLQIFVDGDVARPVVEFNAVGKVESITGGYSPVFNNPEKVREIFNALWEGMF